MLDRGLNALRMYPVPDDVRAMMYRVKHAQGVDIPRIFDGLNDIRNIAPSIKWAKEAGMIPQAALCITTSPVHTLEYYCELADKEIEAGAEELCLKDMAGIGQPAFLGKLTKMIKDKHPNIIIEYHGHSGPGLSMASMLEVAKNGADILDVAIEPLSWGMVHPDVISVQSMLKNAGFDVPEINMDAYMKARAMTQEFIDEWLGYFINPLVSVVLGVIFLQERLRAAQWVSVAISCLAVLMMSLIYGQVPWTGLGVAFSFGIYGLLKARIAHEVSPIVSLSLETLILAPFGVAALFVLNAQGQMTLLSEGAGHFWLLASTGVVTVVPLMLFAAATKALPLSVIGMVQYLGPTIQFILAITVLHEHMSPDKVLGLSLIWVALIIFTVDALRASRSYRASALSDPETGMIPLVSTDNVQAEDVQIILEEQEQTQRPKNK